MTVQICFVLLNHFLNPRLNAFCRIMIIQKPAADDFAHFHTKISNIRANLNANNALPVSVNIPTPKPVATFEFTHVSKDCVREVIMNLSPKTCALDPMPTYLLKKSINVLLPVISDVVN